MAITDYSSLKSAIRDWLTEQSTTVLPEARIEDFIRFVEDDLNSMAVDPRTPDKKGFRMLEMQKAKFTTIQNNSTTGEPDPWVSLPDGFLDMRYITESSQDTQGPLEYVSPQGLLAKETEQSGQLTVYTISNGQIRLPKSAVSEGQTLEMGYYERIPALSSENASNWLLEKSSRVYLYGAMTHARPFLQNENVSPYLEGYNDAVYKLIDANDMAETTQGSVQVPTSYAVP